MLLRACVLSPCCFIEVDLEKTTALERYADAIGLAFQIKDDIIEAEGKTEDIGKSSHSDIDQSHTLILHPQVYTKWILTKDID